MGTRIEVMVDVGERYEMRKSFCFRHVASCTMWSWSISYHVSKLGDEECIRITVGERRCVRWLLAGGEDCVLQGGEGKGNDKETCGF